MSKRFRNLPPETDGDWFHRVYIEQLDAVAWPRQRNERARWWLRKQLIVILRNQV